MCVCIVYDTGYIMIKYIQAIHWSNDFISFHSIPNEAMKTNRKIYRIYVRAAIVCLKKKLGICRFFLYEKK